MKEPNPPPISSAEEFEPKAEEQLDQEALKRSNGDLALWFHHRTLMIGECLIYQRGGEQWITYERTKSLKQYPAVEQSVICGWRKYVQNTTGLPSRQQADTESINRALVLDWVTRKRGAEEIAEVFKRRPMVFYRAAKDGDVNFFQTVGRLIGRKQDGNRLAQFDCAFVMLSHWITEQFWLMQEKQISEHISLRLGIADNLRRFMAVKVRYGLKSHKPSLISGCEKVNESCKRTILTQHGANLLGLRRA